MNICVFCSAGDLEEKYSEPAREFARLIAKNKHSLIWGGSNTGLMRTVADVVQEGGSKIVGISVELLRHQVHQTADELIIAKDLGERKAKMLDRADALVVMVGGIGTLDEVAGVLELKKHRVHDKPVVILNTGGFYEGLQKQLQRMSDEGFLPRPLGELMYFAATPAEAMRYIEAHGN